MGRFGKKAMAIALASAVMVTPLAVCATEENQEQRQVTQGTEEIAVIDDGQETVATDEAQADEATAITVEGGGDSRRGQR
ncbi:MAG: hypothetical protein E7B11_22750 [Clostridiales bacterium]|nr:hypothetical protein [Clostridiales bacterium]MDU3243382.1 hypothetical protein [Clostridiales bacterium]